MHFGSHIGFLAASLDLRQNLRWPRSVFHIVWSEVHESTEKTLTGKRAVFTLDLTSMSNVRGVARIWCQEGHESKKNNVRVTPKYYEIIHAVNGDKAAFSVLLDRQAPHEVKCQTLCGSEVTQKLNRLVGSRGSTWPSAPQLATPVSNVYAALCYSPGILSPARTAVVMVNSN